MPKEESTAAVLLRLLAAIGLGVAATASPLFADCNTNPPTCSNPGVLTVLETGNGSTQGGTCPSAPSLRCSTPKIQDVTYTRTDPACDPTLVACAMTATIDVEFPRNSWNYCDGNSVLGSGLFFVNGAQQAQCGNAPWTVNTDFATFTVTRSIACSDTNTYTFEAAMCGHGFCGFSAFRSLDFVGNRASGCIPPDPPKASCGGGSGSMGANMCCFGPGGGSSPAGAPPGFAIPGMNARLVYQAGGLERSRAFRARLRTSLPSAPAGFMSSPAAS